MSVESALAAAKSRYVYETRQRISVIISELSAIRDNPTGDVDRPIGRIREQEGASREAGFERVARLCQAAENYLDGIGENESVQLPAVVDTVLDVCRAIELHAEAVAKVVIYFDSDHHRKETIQGRRSQPTAQK